MEMEVDVDVDSSYLSLLLNFLLLIYFRPWIVVLRQNSSVFLDRIRRQVAKEMPNVLGLGLGILLCGWARNTVVLWRVRGTRILNWKLHWMVDHLGSYYLYFHVTHFQFTNYLNCLFNVIY